MFTCPVCYYDRLEDPPADYNICECCGTEFGLDDDGRSWEELRAEWLGSGARWFFEQPPPFWNPYMQLFRANFPPLYTTEVILSGPVPFGERIISRDLDYVYAENRRLAYAA
jgi:hypothetical protein